MGSFEIKEGTVSRATTSVGEPTFLAKQGEVAFDQRGIMYRQMAPGEGCDWRPVDVRAKSVQKFWFHNNILPAHDGTTLTVLGTVTPPAVTDPGADYWTHFTIYDAMEIYGLGIPVRTYTSGTFSVKAAIFDRQPTSAYGSMPYKCVKDAKDNYCTFSISAFTPSGNGVLFVPLASPADTDPYILEAGDYILNHVWGTQPVCALMTRAYMDFTADNMNRSDRTRASGVPYASRDFTTDRHYGLIGSGASGSTSMANVNFCLFGKKI